MILALSLLGCDGPASDEAPASAPDPTPTAGVYAMTVAEEWEGDCDFQDPATYEAPEQEWTFDPRDDVLIFYEDFWTPLYCTLDGLDFSCDDGSRSEGRFRVTRLVEGTFPDAQTVSGAVVVQLDCSGTGCDTLKDLYGRGLDVPCEAQAAFDGVLE
jgi:hypothetical protein